jgi:hypothetical protein
MNTNESISHRPLVRTDSGSSHALGPAEGGHVLRLYRWIKTVDSSKLDVSYRQVSQGF